MSHHPLRNQHKLRLSVQLLESFVSTKSPCDGVICCCPTHDGINEKGTQSKVITKAFLETADYLRQMFASLRILWKYQERMLTKLGLTKAEIDIYYDGLEDEKKAVMAKVE